AGGIDIVLNSLAHEHVDASLTLLRDNGVFLEIGKTDIRESVDAPVIYRPFDLIDAGPDRIGQMMHTIIDLITDTALDPLPVTTFDITAAPDALRILGQAKHTGKLAVTLPASPDPDGTVVITGGTGSLAQLSAERLIAEHGVRNLVLVS